MSDGSGSGSGRRRGQGRRRSRGRTGRSSHGQAKAQRNKRRGHDGNYAKPKSGKSGGGRRRRRSGSQRHKTKGAKSPKGQNRSALGASRYFTGELNEFELFCAYHLGIRPDGSYRNSSLDEVAKRFDTNAEGIKRALEEYQMDSGRVAKSSFDLSMARLDIEVAPPGIDRVELARTIFQDFLDSGCGIGPVPKPVTNGDPRSRS